MSCAGFLVYLLLIQAVGSTGWPKGKYALFKPDTGCPDGWKDKGWLFQATNDLNPKNSRSENLHIDGNVRPSYVFRSFCVKTALGEGDNWPKGKYCLYKTRNSAVTGMTAGWIKLDDNKSGSYKTTATYINYYEWIHYALNTRYHYLTLHYHCKTDGNAKDPISLPITKPFYLQPYGSSNCQQVKWMVATSEWIKYDLTNPNAITSSRVKPHFSIIAHSSSDKEIRMYYCYYRSCNYTLNDTSGVFQSPGFPGKYPDGQLCSWRIMVPDNHTLHVHFTNFSLDENDNVTLFRNYNGSFQLNDTFQGYYNNSFTITASSNVLFVFETNEEERNIGFRAEYILSKALKTTPPPPSTTRNIGFTTVPTKESRNNTNNSTTDTFKKSRVSECDGASTAVLIVVPLICLIVVIAVIIIFFYGWRKHKTKCGKSASPRSPKEDVMNPTYDDAGNIQINQRTSTATMNTTIGTDDKDGQMYQALSHDQQPEYEAPDYSKQNSAADSSMDSGYPEYHELEPMGNNVPDVVYDVLEGPDSNDGPSGDQMYQALDETTTHNPLYQSTTPAAMVTRNPMYVDSVA